MHDVEHSHHQYAGYYIWQIKPAVLAYSADGHLRIETDLHYCSPPWARRFNVSLIF